MKITHDDIMFYKKYEEWYHYEYYKQHNNLTYTHKYQVTDVVQISKDIWHDTGYAGQYGIITGLSISGNVYVLAFDQRVSRYWVCRFSEDNLTLINRKYDKMGELTDNFIHYLTKNQFEISTAAFKESWENFKNTPKNKTKANNVIYVDFKGVRQ